MSPPPRPLRPLLLAEQCNPAQFSVPLVGWSHVEALFRRVDLRPHLVTQVRNREALLEAGMREGEDFTAIDTEAVTKRVYRVAGLLGGGGGKGWTTLAALKSISDAAFERAAWKRFRGPLASGEFDLVHRITPLSPTRPCRFAGKLRKLRGERRVPLVLGPLNGGLPWPPGFNDARHAEREWLSYVRDAARLLPGRRSTLKHTGAFLIGSRATWTQMPPAVRDRCLYVPENAVDPRRFPGLDAEDPPAARGGGPLELVFLGRLVPYKCCDLLLRAGAGLLRSGGARLRVIGDGPERPRLEALAAELGIEDRVEFAGWIPHAEVAGRLAVADVLAFPSVREFGGGVVAEAMAAGVVPIVVDYGGPAELLDASCGWVVPLGGREAIVAGLSAVLAEAADDQAGVARRAAAGKRRVRDLLTWDAKAEQTASAYRWVLGERSGRGSPTTSVSCSPPPTLERDGLFQISVMAQLSTPGSASAPSGTTCLVTGAAGLIGSHTVELRLAKGDRVVGIDDFNTYYDPAQKRDNVAGFLGHPNFTLAEVDIRDKAAIDGLFDEHRFDRVAHLAAMANVRYAIGRTPLYTDVNVTASVHLLEAAWRTWEADGRLGEGSPGTAPGVFAFASTSSAYGKTADLPFREDDPSNAPLSAYPACKKAVELLGHTYANLHAMNFTALRFFSVYGPGPGPT